MTVLENLELGSFLPDAKAARRESLEQVFELFPVVKDKLHARAGSLSGGQQQMVAIVLSMFGAIRKIYAAGVSVLLVEQNVGMTMDVARRAYVLEEGRIVTQGPTEDLMDKPEIRKAYLGLS